MHSAPLAAAPPAATGGVASPHQDSRQQHYGLASTSTAPTDADLRAVLQGAIWLDALAADVNAPTPRSPEDLVAVISAALERKVLTPVPLRRAPRLDEHLDEAISAIYPQEGCHLRLPPNRHVGSMAVDTSGSDMRELLSFWGDEATRRRGVTSP